MTDEQKVYIRGVEGRGKDVIKILRDLGGKNPPLDVGGDPSYIYYISHDGDITCALYGSEVGKIIRDFYREIKLSGQWKDGDILVKDNDPNSFVVRSNVSTGSWGEFFFRAHFLVNPAQIIESPMGIFCNAEYHKADSEELRRFHELLHKYNKDWDVEKRLLVNWRWKPKINEIYWIVYGSLNITSFRWADSPTDKTFFNLGNCFQSYEKAEAMAEKIKKLFKGE